MFLSQQRPVDTNDPLFVKFRKAVSAALNGRGAATRPTAKAPRPKPRGPETLRDAALYIQIRDGGSLEAAGRKALEEFPHLHPVNARRA